MENGIMLGIRLTLLGMSVVFASLIALALLIGALSAFDGPRQPRNACTPVAPGNEESGKAKDARVVAAIAAALAYHLELSAVPRVVSIKKVGGISTSWGAAGRQVQMIERARMFVRRGSNR
ncbi:MAG: OadG family protein [Bacillota bacterium]